MTSLADLYPRIRAALHDDTGLAYTPVTLDEAVRQALTSYAAGNIFPVRLSGLDGALDTTLPAAHEALIVTGASGYAALARAAALAGQAHPDSDPAPLREWAEVALACFRHLLAQVFPALGASPESAAQAEREDMRQTDERTRLGQLHNAATPPWRAWTPWEE